MKKDQGPDILLCRSGGNSLRFESNAANRRLVLTSEDAEARTGAHVKKYCKGPNTKGHIICW
jgi:hypothetical protein